jgi:hypothetical protein
MPAVSLGRSRSASHSRSVAASPSAKALGYFQTTFYETCLAWALGVFPDCIFARGLIISAFHQSSGSLNKENHNT